MLSKEYLISTYSAALVKDAEELLEHEDAVQDMTLKDDDGMHELAGKVRGRDGRYTDTTVWFSGDNSSIFDAECSCRMYHNTNRCAHIPALVLYYETNRNSSRTEEGEKSDDGITTLLHELEDPMLDPEISGTVALYPYIRPDGSDAVGAEFRIGRHHSKTYILQDIHAFISCIDRHENKRYGSQLEFVHDLAAFDTPSKPLVIFLRSLVNKEDTYQSGGSMYGWYDDQIHRYLSLKGRYLDSFMEAVKDLPLHVEKDSETFIYTRREGLPHLEADLHRSGTGWFLTTPSLTMFKGSTMVYIIDEEEKVYYAARRSSEKLVALLEYMMKTDAEPQYIAPDDLPSFARDLYPVLTRNVILHNEEGFDPYAYLPMKPSYEIYLDRKDDDTVTCGLFACYGETRHNISLSGDIRPEGRRDVTDERAMNTFVSKWFNSVNPLMHNFILADDDDMLFNLVSEGIPAMQKKAQVYISDSMHKITMRRMPSVSVGVSVTDAGLLQLNFQADTMSMEQVAEILSRYDRRKRYYRLKTGEFIDLENSDAFHQLDDLSDALQLKTADLAGGEAEVPKYRALYLESMEEEASLELDRDEKFRKLISQLHNTDIDEYEVPADLDPIMRSYQKEGFRWLSALYENGFGALLADEMGLGKTLQVLAFLKANHQDGRAIIACPASLVYNWYQEIHKFTPSLKARMIQGPADIRQEDIRRSDPDEILITSYDLLKRDMEVYETMSFTFEIIDEAQYIKNAGTQASKAVKALHARFRIALTGTPIENRLSELWSIFDYIMPGFFRSYRSFRETYEIPIVKEKDDFMEVRLERMIRPFVLRRRKKDVLKELPDKLERVYYAQADTEQRELYDAHTARIKASLASKTNAEFKHDRIEILAELTRLRQLCCDPRLLYSNYRGGSAKEDLCIDLIRNAVEAGHKVLLFSQFTSMLDLLTARLNEEKISWYLLKGSTPKAERARLVEAFQHDDVPVFCISLKAGGTGLNLTAADIVIHYDPWWNTAVENQASDRAHRIGQKNVVSVCRLIMKDTIEERILALQSSKADLAGRLMNGEGISSASLTRDDLLAILE
jgi:superfamily II DNA or RNA helicase